MKQPFISNNKLSMIFGTIITIWAGYFYFSRSFKILYLILSLANNSDSVIYINTIERIYFLLDKNPSNIEYFHNILKKSNISEMRDHALPRILSVAGGEKYEADLVQLINDNNIHFKHDIILSLAITDGAGIEKILKTYKSESKIDDVALAMARFLFSGDETTINIKGQDVNIPITRDLINAKYVLDKNLPRTFEIMITLDNLFRAPDKRSYGKMEKG